MPPREDPEDSLFRLFKPHPWHGIAVGEGAPGEVAAYIEIVPTDTVKYEIDKASGHLRVDRPQRFSNVCPTLYGFVPRTYCGPRVAELCRRRVGREVRGDGDPLDLCVLSERAFTHGDVLVTAVPVGGLRMIDRGEADDKVLAVLAGDAVFGEVRDVGQLPPSQVERLKHYFLTYKQPPGEPSHAVEIAEVYGRETAHEVILAALADYDEQFPDLEARLRRVLAGG
ncbi:MAG TPA: inorganic pyrophosphatase [Thermoanaerobaculia bacterium]|nr:inorganic pyrophosphatase [Thermoanaerobaculia bacterium]